MAIVSDKPWGEYTKNDPSGVPNTSGIAAASRVPSLAYPLSLKTQASKAPFVHINVCEAASQMATKFAIGIATPMSVKIGYNATWESVDLGVLTGEVAKGAGELMGLVQAQNKNDTFLDGLLATGLKGIGQAADQITGMNATAAAEIMAGVMVNPHAALRFKGMAFRDFMLDFVFLPKSQAEADEVLAIIFQLKYAMHPEGSSSPLAALGAVFGNVASAAGGGYAGTGPANLAGMSRYFVYPNNVILTFYAPNLKALVRTSPCAILNCTVEYNGAGIPAFFYTSHPVCITMSLQLREQEILTKQRIREGW